MPMTAQAELGQFPDSTPAFQTERYTLLPLKPPEMRNLLEVMLGDAPLAGCVPWMTDKSADGARREAFLVEMEMVAGTVRGWGVVERASRTYVGAVLARQSLAGIDLEVLCPSHFWGQGISDEVSPPVSDWLEEHTEVDLVFRQ